MKKVFNKKTFYTILIILNIFFYVLNISNAEVSFSEINYDPEGADSGYEWVEIYNNNLSIVDLTKYKFCEGGTCHGISANNLNKKIIPKNTFAIISSKPDKFLEKNNGFSGIIFKSSFSLKNTDGERMELQNDTKNIISMLDYNPEIGGKNGDTLSIIDNILVNSEATPGNENIFKEKQEKKEDDSVDNENKNNKDTVKNTDNKEEKPKIQRAYVEIKDNKSDLLDGEKKIKTKIDDVDIIIAGASHEYSAKVFEITGADIEKKEQIKYFWNFGDGTISNKSNPKHAYASSGEYIISFKAFINGWSGQTKILVNVLDAPVLIKTIDYKKGKIILENKSDFIINIGGYKIKSGDRVFEIPEDTFVNKKSEILFDKNDLKINLVEDIPVKFMYNNGKEINLFKVDFVKILKDKIKNVEQEIQDKENELKKINQENIIKKDIIWQASNQDISEVEKLKWKVEKEKVLFELEKLRIKKEELLRDAKFKKEKKERALKKELDKEEELLKKKIDKEKKLKEENKKKEENDSDGVNKESLSVTEKNKVNDSEEVVDLSKTNLEQSKSEKSFSMLDFLMENIFEFILGIFILIISILTYFYKRYNYKIKENEKADNDNKKNKWDIEEI